MIHIRMFVLQVLDLLKTCFWGTIGDLIYQILIGAREMHCNKIKTNLKNRMLLIVYIHTFIMSLNRVLMKWSI